MEAYIQNKKEMFKRRKKDKTWLKSKIWCYCSLNHNEVTYLSYLIRDLSS